MRSWPKTLGSRLYGSLSTLLGIRSYIERIERLEDEKAALAADIREIYSEARGNGFDVRVMRQLIRLRKLDAQDRAEREALLDLYRSAVGV